MRIKYNFLVNSATNEKKVYTSDALATNQLNKLALKSPNFVF